MKTVLFYYKLRSEEGAMEKEVLCICSIVSTVKTVRKRMEDKNKEKEKKEKKPHEKIRGRKRTTYNVKDINSAHIIMRRFPINPMGSDEEIFLKKYPSVKHWINDFQKKKDWEEKLENLLEIFNDCPI